MANTPHGSCLALGLLVAALAGCGRTGSPPASAPTLTPAAPAAILAAVRAPGAKAVVVNVWASWCVPCRQEFPDLLKLGRAYRERGVRLVLISADLDQKDAEAFLASQAVDFPSWLKLGGDQDFIDALSSKWTGALPASFIYDGSGQLKESWEGEANYARFESAVKSVLDAHGR